MSMYLTPKKKITKYVEIPMFVLIRVTGLEPATYKINL